MARPMSRRSRARLEQRPGWTPLPPPWTPPPTPASTQVDPLDVGAIVDLLPRVAETLQRWGAAWGAALHAARYPNDYRARAAAWYLLTALRRLPDTGAQPDLTLSEPGDARKGGPGRKHCEAC